MIDDLDLLINEEMGVIQLQFFGARLKLHHPSGSIIYVAWIIFMTFFVAFGTPIICVAALKWAILFLLN